MAGIKALVGLSFSGAIGLTFLMLGCALEYYGVYWPMFVLIFYFICPIPHFIARRVSDDSDAASSACRELAYFFTTGIVVSAFGFPIILARVEATSSSKQDVSSNHSDHVFAVGLSSRGSCPLYGPRDSSQELYITVPTAE